MNTIAIMSVVGSAVPQALRDSGLLACWYVVKNGKALTGPLTSLVQAKALQATLNAPPLH